MVQAEAPTDSPAVAPVADPAPIEAAPVAEPVIEQGQAGAVVEGAVEEAPKPISLSDIPDDDLLAHLRERKNGDGLSLEDRLRKSAVDQYEDRKRKETGTIENVTKRTARALQKYGIDPAEVSPDDMGGLNALSYYANIDALGATAQAWVRASAREMGMADDPLLEEALAKYIDDPTDSDALASRMMLSLRDSVRARTLSEASLKDVPEGSKLHADLKVEASRLAAAELEAQRIAAARPDSPPTAPAGTPSPTEHARFAAMTAGEVSYLSAPERARWREWKSQQPDSKAS